LLASDLLARRWLNRLRAGSYIATVWFERLSGRHAAQLLEFGLDDFHQTVALSNESNDARQSRLEPRSQSAIGGVADPQPHDHGAGGLLRVRPDRAVAAPAQARVLDVRGFVPGLAQPTGQRGRQLGINQKLHLASDITA